MSILNLLSSSSYLIINKDLIKALGFEETLLVGELASEYVNWYKKGKLDNDFFYSTIDNVEKNTGLSRYKQAQALNTLKKLGIVETKLKGLPAKRYIKIYEEKIEQVIQDQMYKDFMHSCKTGNRPDCEKFTTNNNNINNNKNNNNYYSNLDNSNTLIYSSNYIKEKEINKEKDPFTEYYE